MRLLLSNAKVTQYFAFLLQYAQGIQQKVIKRCKYPRNSHINTCCVYGFLASPPHTQANHIVNSLFVCLRKHRAAHLSRATKANSTKEKRIMSTAMRGNKIITHFNTMNKNLPDSG